MRRLMAVAVLVLAAACDSPTYNAGRVLPQTDWRVNPARYTDGTVESAGVVGTDVSGKVTLTYRVMCRPTVLRSLAVDDPGSAPQMAVAVFEPDTAHVTFPLQRNGATSAELVGEMARTFTQKARAAWTVTVYHSDASVHVWGAEKLGAAVDAAERLCGA